MSPAPPPRRRWSAVHQYVPHIAGIDLFLAIYAAPGRQLTPRHYALPEDIGRAVTTAAVSASFPPCAATWSPPHWRCHGRGRAAGRPVRELLVISQDTSAYGIDTPSTARVLETAAR